MSETSPQQAGANFGFLEKHDRRLAALGGFAELYASSDPNTSLVKQRQFIERLAQLAAARFGVESNQDLRGLIDELHYRRLLEPDVAQSFHFVRREGNRANHEMTGTEGEAVHALKRCRMLGTWYARTFVERGLKPGPFVAPRPPEDPAAGLRAEIAEQRSRIAELRRRAESAEEKAALEEEARRAAEAEVKARDGDVRAALALLDESEEEKERYRQRLAGYQARAAASSEAARRQLYERSRAAASVVELDEAATRKLIDADLRQAGWQADSERLTYGRGARPHKGRNLAIAEWPTENGPADYVLFRGRVPLAVVEAKRRRKNAANAIDQARRYSRGFVLGAGDPSPGGPWGDREPYRIPFLFATNGRPFLRQVLEESGIWFLDARRATNHPRALEGWYTPEGLEDLLRLDEAAADSELAATAADDLPLRDYQVEAVHAVEAAIARGQREVLLAMATGTGKTRTTIALLYRLVRAGRFRRALFVVDRSALGEQAGGTFKELPLDAQQPFANIYDVKQLGEVRPERDTRVQIATVQSLVRRTLYPPEGASDATLPVDAYDLIVVDECHRGYTLDREMGDAELAFRDQADYVSKYRRALDHFDAVKVGLTATPALHTTEIFGEPVYRYSYRQAVIDGFLVDHEPPVRIVTGLAEDGIHWEVGEEVSVYDAGKGQMDLIHTPDEIDLEVEDFNRKVITENFNRAVCRELAKHLDPTLPGKTLVFCVDDRHAVLVVRLLKEAFTEQYGEVDDETVKKITGATDDPLGLIRHYKNEALPSVAVTVDLLTTGIDVPEITRLVFLRRVRSRILYEQMLGRATRLCPDLYGRGEDKEVFRIYDAVDLYAALKDHTDMTPVVVSPTVRFEDLVEDLFALSDAGARRAVLDQLVVKLRRKRRRIEAQLADRFEAAAGMSAGALIGRLRRMTLEEAAEYFRQHPLLVELLDRRLPGPGVKLFVSEHEDEVRRVEAGYGRDRQRPEDYLESFGRFLTESGNRIPAILVVTRRPRELTRQQLKELKYALDEAGYGERELQSAWREWKNEDVAASIIGFIRQRALGDPLKPYAERVDAALKRLLAGRDWTPVQRRWLERIGKQMKIETVVDREALDQGQFRSDGGFNRFNRLFDGRMEEVLGDLHEAVWSA